MPKVQVAQTDFSFKEAFFETGSSTDYLNAISYHVPLNDGLQSWIIQHDYFMFKLNPQEQGSEYIYILKFDNTEGECATLKLKDLFDKHMGVSQELFFYGNEKTIKIVDIKPLMPEMRAEKESVVEEKDIYVYEINSPNRLLGFFENGFSKNDTYIMCAIETDDNQIDFTRLYKWERSIEIKDVEFFQYREVVTRDLHGDPITKFDQIINNEEFQFGIALRQSGAVDIYWNFTRVNTPLGMTFTDIAATFDSLYMRETDGTLLQMDVKWDARIGIDVSEEFLCEKSRINQIYYPMIKDQVKEVTGYCLLDTQVAVSYNNVLSIYDLFRGQWVNHFFFDSDIYDIKRNQTITQNQAQNENAVEYNLAIFFKNGIIKILERVTSDNMLYDTFILKDEEHKMNGNIIGMADGNKDFPSQYIMTENKGIFQMYAFQGGKLFDLKQDIVDIFENDQLIKLFSSDVAEDFGLFNKTTGNLRLYHNDAMNISKCFDKNLTDYHEITGRVHTVMTCDDIKGCVLFDEKNFYQFDTDENTLEIFKDYYFRAICQMDPGYIYSTNCSNGEDGTRMKSGLYYQSLINIIESKKDRTYHLDDTLVGTGSMIDFHKYSERLTFLTSYEQIMVVPLLHRNVVQFIGMKGRDDYVVLKKDKDKLIALNKENQLISWSIVTGKMLTKYKLTNGMDYSKWVTYKCEPIDVTYSYGWNFPRSLLKFVDPITDYDETLFFEQNMLNTSLNNNTAYLKIVQKEFFEFKMIEIISDREIKEHFSFIHPFYNDGNYQRIYFNDNLEYMLERLLNQRVFLYQKVSTDVRGQVRWQIIRRIEQFPKDISECTYNNFLFSPDFKYYLDYDKKTDVFLIKNTFTQKFHCQIPRGLMNPKQEKPASIAKRFKWVDSSRVRIINNEGIEKIVDITSGFKEIAYGVVPFFDDSSHQDINQYHFYEQPPAIEIDNTYDRLKRKFNQYKSAYYLDKYNGKKIYEILFNVEYEAETNFQKKCVADLSFTFIHWKKIRSIIRRERFDFKQIDIDELRTLCLNILPRCETIIHFCDTRMFIVQQIFNIAKQQRELKEENGDSKEFYIPIIQNINGKSPFHKCFERKNYKSADILLSKLMDEPLDHHGRAIIDAMPQVVENELPSLGKYLNARFQQTQQLEAIRRGNIKVVKGTEYSIGVAQMWTDVKALEQQVLTPSPLDTEIKLELWDIPQVHCYQEKIGDEFFDSLANVSMDYFSIFGEQSIQALIDYKWPLAREFTINYLFIPFLFYLITFILFSNIFFGQIEATENVLNGDYALSIILLCFSFYFLILETKQLISNGLGYFKSYWNYSDIVPPILIITVVIVHFIHRDDPPNVLASVHSAASLLMWSKFLYFLRIFRKTGYFIRMLTDVVYDIRIFLLILLIMYFGFGEAFLRISEQAQNEEGQFIHNYADAVMYAFLGSLGQADTGSLINTDQTVYIWIIYCIMSVIIAIIMLNLLIAIISEAFAKINENIVLANYQERARIIAENSYLIPWPRKVAFCEKNKYMIVAREKEEKEADNQEELVRNVKDLQEQFSDFKKEISDKLQTIIANQH